VSKAKLEGLFADELAMLQPTASHMRLLKESVLRIWKARKAALREELDRSERTAKAIQDKLNRLDEAFLCERSIDIEKYDRHAEKLREELTLARIDRHSGQLEELDVQPSTQLRHPQLVRAFTTECKDDLVARGVHPEQERLLERTDQSMRSRGASLDADGHELPEDSRTRMTQKEETRAVPGPRQCWHTILILRRERPAAADRHFTHDYFALIGPSGYPTAVGGESHGVQGNGQRGFAPAFQITRS
jgi:hypothetical protein